MTRRYLWTMFCTLVLSGITAATIAHAALLRNHPVDLSQPDGKVLHLFVSGDEHFNWVHDGEGYTIIQDPQSGYYTYAVLAGGIPVSSNHIAGQVNPAAVGIPKHILPAKEKMQELMASFPSQSVAAGGEIQNAPTKGTMNNLVVFIRFQGEAEFNRRLVTIAGLFQNSSDPNNMQYYFKEASYKQLTIWTTFYPPHSQGNLVSFEDSMPRSYYEPQSAANPNGYTGGDGGADRMNREHALLANAVNAISSQVPASLNIDADNDGLVDNVTFIIKGDPKGWNNLLWPHAWQLSTQAASINGKRVWTYSFQLEKSVDTDGVGVLCHEMFHTMGAPDLYRYNEVKYDDAVQPVAGWDLMEETKNPPQHMCAYMKYRYGKWITSIPEIKERSTYYLLPLSESMENVYSMDSLYSEKEFFIVEFRKKTTIFEKSLPGEGLIVYRINGNQDGKGNSQGPPDEVYVYRPGGSVTSNGNPEAANFSADVGRTEINDSTYTWSFLTTGLPGGLRISKISSIGGFDISFYVDPIQESTAKVTLPLIIAYAAGENAEIYAAVSNQGNIPLPLDAHIEFWIRANGVDGVVGSYPAYGPGVGYMGYLLFNWKIPLNVYGSAKCWARVYSDSKPISDWSPPQDFKIQARGKCTVKIARMASSSRYIPIGSTIDLGAYAEYSCESGYSNPIVWFYVQAPGLPDPWIASKSLWDADRRYENAGYCQITWIVPGTVKPGVAKLWAIVYDGDNPVSSWSDSLEFTILAAQGMSAKILSLWEPEYSAAGYKTTLWALIQNTGSIGCQGTVSFWVPKVSKTAGGSAYFNLAPGETKWYSFDWNVPGNLAAGEYSYCARINFGYAPIDNWSAGQKFTINPGGFAVKILSLWPVTGATTGSWVTLWAKVKSLGSLAMPSNAIIYFQVSVPVHPFVGYVSLEGLAPGAEKWIEFSWYIPKRLTPGNYNYSAQILADYNELTPRSAEEAFVIQRPAALPPGDLLAATGREIFPDLRPASQLSRWVSWGVLSAQSQVWALPRSKFRFEQPEMTPDFT